MGEERLGPPEHPAVSPVPRSSRDPFPVAAALDRGHSHETKGTVPLSHLRRWPVSQGQPQDSPRPFSAVFSSGFSEVPSRLSPRPLSY